MQRWRKPPILALAYISPARSSKRRMSIIRARIASEVFLPGSECIFCASTPLPSDFWVRVASLVATRAESTRWEGSSKTRATPLPGGSVHGRGRVLEPIVAVEEPVAKRDGGHARYAPLDRLVRGVDELLLDRVALDVLEDRLRMQFTGRAGEQDRVDVVEAAAGVELLAKGSE